MITELMAGYTAAKHAFTAVKGISDLKTEVEVNRAISEVLQHLNDVQLQLSEAQRRYDELAEQKRQSDAVVAAHKEWENEATRYKLKEIAPSVFVYELTEAGRDPMHWLCPNCFQKKAKSIFQRTAPGNHTFECHVCELMVCELAELPLPRRRGSY